MIRVEASSVNPADWHILRGQPVFSRLSLGLFRPKQKVLGADFAGIVVQVGSKDSAFKVGDRVFGQTLLGGAFAEYISVSESNCAHMPEGAGFGEMACVPVAGLTALQAVVTHGKLKKGERVLINGASGGVGHFAVQLAKTVGAEVTAVCSGKNADFVKSLGADTVIPYDQQDIHSHKGNYQLVVDMHGNLTHADYRRMGQRGVAVGFTMMRHMFSVVFRKAFSRFPLVQFTIQANQKDLETLSSMIQSGQVRVHIEKMFAHTALPEAISYIEAMRTRGKVGISWTEDAALSFTTDRSPINR